MLTTLGGVEGPATELGSSSSSYPCQLGCIGGNLGMVTRYRRTDDLEVKLEHPATLNTTLLNCLEVSKIATSRM